MTSFGEFWFVSQIYCLTWNSESDQLVTHMVGYQETCIIVSLTCLHVCVHGRKKTQPNTRAVTISLICMSILGMTIINWRLILWMFTESNRSQNINCHGIRLIAGKIDNAGKVLQTSLQYCYRKTSNIIRTLESNKIVDNSDVVGAAPDGAAPTTSSFST